MSPTQCLCSAYSWFDHHSSGCWRPPRWPDWCSGSLSSVCTAPNTATITKPLRGPVSECQSPHKSAHFLTVRLGVEASVCSVWCDNKFALNVAHKRSVGNGRGRWERREGMDEGRNNGLESGLIICPGALMTTVTLCSIALGPCLWEAGDLPQFWVNRVQSRVEESPGETGGEQPHGCTEDHPS